VAVAVMPDASGNGYWLVTATGHVYAFGDAENLGGGAIDAYGDVPNDGSIAARHLNGSIVAATGLVAVSVSHQHFGGAGWNRWGAGRRLVPYVPVSRRSIE